MASPRKRPLPAEDTDSPSLVRVPCRLGRLGGHAVLDFARIVLSSVTRKSSPTKQFRHAELWEDGFAVRKINHSHNKPADKIQPLTRLLCDLKARLNQVSLGVHLLPERCRDEPKGPPSKSINFCIVVRPENLAEEVEEREKMERLGKYRFGNSINHSVQGNLCCCPIDVSIETKHPGGQWDDALLQMGTWQAAQWRSYTQHGLPPSPVIEFLPGIIVHGHQWRFVATVRQGSKAVLLTEIDIGTTLTEFGVIQIVIALEILKRWSAEVF
ncbi:hypothetical protein QIS74_04900 [Colletotrichum tabaci]|uniref:PD-(D/E)XK nuclease-like domain-containing protein n=1 Tax=Colletotrichum tabaci TaxID=1209068 RepID=A0AAV9TIS2_9PEZI